VGTPLQGGCDGGSAALAIVAAGGGGGGGGAKGQGAAQEWQGEGREAGGRGACQQQEEKVLEQGMVVGAAGQDRAPQGDAAALQGRGEGVPGGGNTKGHCWGPPIRGAVCKVVDHVDMMGSRAQGGGSVTRFVWCSNHQHAAHYV
jgi:hypothetical protein